MAIKKVWYQNYINRINEKLKEFRYPQLEHEDFTKNRYYCVYQVTTKEGKIQRLVFVCSKFQKNIDIYTKDLEHGKTKN